ncbi:MAG: LysM peptidoglycan-binding domain-containing protein, partial [Draconibacterium sp.]
AAYNRGPGNVNNAIARNDGKRHYWAIYYNLPKEPRGYVPSFIAAAYFMNFYKEHNLIAKMPDFPIVTDSIMIDNYLQFDQISEKLDISIEEIKALNPQYKINIIPGRPEKPYPLVLPSDKITSFIEQEDSIFAYNREKYFPNNEIKKPTGTRSTYSASGKDRLQYTVRSGDVIGKIAGKFNVSSSSIRSWNNLRGNLIRVGQKLNIYVPAGSGSRYASYSGTRLISSASKGSASSSTSSSSAQGKTTSSGGWVYYTVKSGDTLWSIAKKFPGISSQNIKTANGMKTDKLKIGQNNKIKRKLST